MVAEGKEFDSLGCALGVQKRMSFNILIFFCFFFLDCQLILNITTWYCVMEIVDHDVSNVVRMNTLRAP